MISRTILDSINDAYIVENHYKNMIQLIGKIKVLFGRAGSYISMMNLLMLSYLTIRQLGIDINPFLIIPLIFLFFLFLGYADQYFGIFRAENSVNNDHNPQIVKLLNDVEEIKRRLS